MSRVVRTTLAKRDAMGYFVYVGDHNPEAAFRFREDLVETFHFLAENPQIGIPTEVEGRKYTNLRRWPMRHFPSILIFYQPIPTGVRILRVIHASRDFRRLFTPED